MSEEDIPDTPLSVMLTLMREKWQAGDHDGAAEVARAAAPYMHHRPAPIAGQAETSLEVHLLTDAELKRRMELLARRMELLADRERATREDPEVPS